MTCLCTREGVLDGGDPLLGLDGPCVLGPIDRERLRLMQKWCSGAGEPALAAAATPDDDVARRVNRWSSTSNQTLNNMGFTICKFWRSLSMIWILFPRLVVSSAHNFVMGNL
jgi:hypothetical protein